MTTASTPNKDIAASAALAAAGLAAFAVASLAAPCALLGAAYVASRLRDPEAGADTPHAPLRRSPEQADDGEPSGTHCLGIEDGTKRRVWLSDADMAKHLAYVGSTGSGKSEALCAVAANALARNSGFLRMDAGGSIATFPEALVLARRMGREDDVLLIDFAGHAGRPGNTFNPLSTGNAETLATLVADTCCDVAEDGTVTPCEPGPLLAPLAALVHLRDHHGVELTLVSLALALEPAPLACLETDTRVPERERADLKTQREATGPQDAILRHVRHRLSPLATRFSAILGGQPADVDMHDIVARRRILVVTLPNLRHTKADNGILGRLVLATLKAAVSGMATRERTRLPGGTRETVPPFLAILDDAGLYAIPGMDALDRDATSANVSLTYGLDTGQVTPMLAGEVGAPLARVGTVALMRMEDRATLDQAMRVATRLAPPDILGLHDALPDRAPPRAREVGRQKEGEMHLVTAGKCVRARSLFVNPTSPDAGDRRPIFPTDPVTTLDLGTAGAGE